MPRSALPKTRAFAERAAAPLFSDEDYRQLAEDAISELEDAADEALGH